MVQNTNGNLFHTRCLGAPVMLGLAYTRIGTSRRRTPPRSLRSRVSLLRCPIYVQVQVRRNKYCTGIHYTHVDVHVREFTNLINRRFLRADGSPYGFRAGDAGRIGAERATTESEAPPYTRIYPPDRAPDTFAATCGHSHFCLYIRRMLKRVAARASKSARDNTTMSASCCCISINYFFIGTRTVCVGTVRGYLSAAAVGELLLFGSKWLATCCVASCAQKKKRVRQFATKKKNWK